MQACDHEDDDDKTDGGQGYVKAVLALGLVIV